MTFNLIAAEAYAYSLSLTQTIQPPPPALPLSGLSHSSSKLPRSTTIAAVTKWDMPTMSALVGAHFHYSQKIPLPRGYRKKSYFKRCKYCWKNHVRRETSMQCGDCDQNPPLCRSGCFENWHREMDDLLKNVKTDYYEYNAL